MKRGAAIILMVLGAAVVSCRQADIRTAAVDVPGMKGRPCAEIIMRALAQEQGVPPERVTVYLDARRLEIRYDSLRHSVKNLEMTIADAGFDANDVPASEEARRRLPAECRP
jgi:copper chaperone CopZ